MTRSCGTIRHHCMLLWDTGAVRHALHVIRGVTGGQWSVSKHRLSSRARSASCPCRRDSKLLSIVGDRRVYFVHSYRATSSPENDDWVLATTEYGGSFISSIQKGEINATQFHPEKSGAAGLDIIQSFLEPPEEARPAYTNGGSLLLRTSTWHLSVLSASFGLLVYKDFPCWHAQRTVMPSLGL